jgi:hypothetical protein
MNVKHILSKEGMSGASWRNLQNLDKCSDLKFGSTYSTVWIGRSELVTLTWGLIVNLLPLQQVRRHVYAVTGLWRDQSAILLVGACQDKEFS